MEKELLTGTEMKQFIIELHNFIYCISQYYMYIQIMLISSICLLLLVSEGASGLQCLTKKSIEDFYKSKKAITEVHTDIEEYVHILESRTIKTLESDLKQTMENYGKRITDLVKNSIGAFKTELGSMDEKIKNLNMEYRVLGKDARSRYINITYRL